MRKIGRTLLSGIAAAAALLLCSCTSAEAPDRDAGDIVASHLRSPWSIAFHGGTALVSERDDAIVLELLSDGTTREAGHVDGVVVGGEGGLLGLAVREGMLYAYSTGGTGNRVQRFPLHGEPGSLRIGEPETVIDGIPSAGNHNGGRIAFGPDGMLYVTTGDAGDRDSAQELGSLGGKILRLTPDGDVPADNPFPGSPVYSLGHRNPQGIAWGADGTLYASEFGQDTWDELNIIRAGENYGWPLVEGIADDPAYTDPVQQWPPSKASPSGIAVHQDAVYIANLRGERLRIVPLDDLGRSEERLTGLRGRLRDVTVTPGGALWMLTSNTDGRGDPDPDDDVVLRLR